MRFEFSAGGIVYKKDPDIKILMCQHSGHHGWVFPKGLIDQGEEKEQTAVREVREETGINAKIETPLSPSEYWYEWEKDPSAGSGREKVKKTVYFYIMTFLGGDFKDHDHEMEQVEWVDYNDVLEKLTYPSDKKVWEEAKLLIK